MFVRTVAPFILVLTALLGQPREPLLVSAAISLTGVLQELGAAYEQQGGVRVTFNFAGSNVLARQIANGAPADLFISADAGQMAYAFEHNAIARTPPPRPLLGNRLAVVTPKGRGAQFRDVAALAAAKRIAIGDPAAVPAGVYAKQYLERAGAWTSLQGKLLPLMNVRAALAAARSGGVDAAIVYATDAAASRNVDLAFVVRDPGAPRILYEAGVVAHSRNKEAAHRFLEFLHSDTAGKVFRRHGFLHGADLGPIGGSP